MYVYILYFISHLLFDASFFHFTNFIRKLFKSWANIFVSAMVFFCIRYSFNLGTENIFNMNTEQFVDEVSIIVNNT